MRFIFIPFAGGSQYSYHNFAQYAARIGIKILPVELPGRGTRFKDPFIVNLEDMVEDIFRQVEPNLVAPYGIYGHSMGSIIGYLLTRKIINLNLPKPFHLFFSGCGGPSVKDNEPSKHLLTKQDFIKKLSEYGGCPQEILNDSMLFDIFEPIIRADFQAVESYKHSVCEPFNIPMTIMIGNQEKTTYEDAVEWQKETKKKIEIIKFEGNHFFILGQEKEIMNIISKRVRNWVYS